MKADGRDEFLRIYMNDQLALGVLWREVARRSERSNRGTEVGDMLGRVASGIAEDVETFESLMGRLGIRANPIKRGFVVAGERLARLKLNGRIRSYSPLSRFVELDFLAMGIDGKKLLWTTLRDLAGLAERLPDVDWEHLLRRADEQRTELEPFRAAAGAEALGRDRSPPPQT